MNKLFEEEGLPSEVREKQEGLTGKDKPNLSFI